MKNSIALKKRKNQNSKIQHRLKADNSKIKNQNSKLKTPIALAIHSPLQRGGGSRKAARWWGFRGCSLNINHMKKYNKPMIAVRYVDIQGICAGSQVQIGPGYATEDACSKGNTTQLSIRDVWEDK